MTPFSGPDTNPLFFVGNSEGQDWNFQGRDWNFQARLKIVKRDLPWKSENVIFIVVSPSLT